MKSSVKQKEQNEWMKKKRKGMKNHFVTESTRSRMAVLFFFLSSIISEHFFIIFYVHNKRSVCWKPKTKKKRSLRFGFFFAVHRSLLFFDHCRTFLDTKSTKKKAPKMKNKTTSRTENVSTISGVCVLNQKL